MSSLEKIELSINKLNAVDNKEKNIEEFIKKFNEEFNLISQKEKEEVKMIIELFKHFEEEIFTTSESYKVALSAKGKLKLELIDTLNDYQKKLLDKIEYCEDKGIIFEIERAFVYGFSMANQLNNESIK